MTEGGHPEAQQRAKATQTAGGKEMYCRRTEEHGVCSHLPLPSPSRPSPRVARPRQRGGRETEAERQGASPGGDPERTTRHSLPRHLPPGIAPRESAEHPRPSPLPSCPHPLRPQAPRPPFTPHTPTHTPHASRIRQRTNPPRPITPHWSLIPPHSPKTPSLTPSLTHPLTRPPLTHSHLPTPSTPVHPAPGSTAATAHRAT